MVVGFDAVNLDTVITVLGALFTETRTFLASVSEIIYINAIDGIKLNRDSSSNTLQIGL